MKNSFEIAINIMGDPDEKIAKITSIINGSEYVITMPDHHHSIALKQNKNNDWVQTQGVPLDSNTIHSIAMALEKRRNDII